MLLLSPLLLPVL